MMAGCMSMSIHAITLDECLQSAQDNYPLINNYGLISSTEDIELSDINKGWLPKVGIYAQSTVQNVVPSFPAALSKVMEQMGGEIRGLGKLQYKLGADINQTIWDGGASKIQREIARSRAESDRASLDVEMYAIRQRIESIYFGILLIESQIRQTESAIGVYQSNLERLDAMIAGGTAMQSDADMVEAQCLELKQRIAQARSAEKGYRTMLSIFTGLDLSDENLEIPSAEIPAELTSDRPELRLMDSQSRLNNLQRGAVNVSLMPKVGFFAQAYYGYPGIDYFKAMMGRDLTFNILAGVKASWNIDSFYTRKNSIKKIEISDSMIDSQRETFLFNSKMQTASGLEEIRGIEAAMTDDARIIALRGNVRRAAESQLRNGVIDATALTMKINDETQACLTAEYHKLQRLQAIYNLKNTLNR